MSDSPYRGSCARRTGTSESSPESAKIDRCCFSERFLPRFAGVPLPMMTVEFETISKEARDRFRVVDSVCFKTLRQFVSSSHE